MMVTASETPINELDVFNEEVDSQFDPYIDEQQSSSDENEYQVRSADLDIWHCPL